MVRLFCGGTALAHYPVPDPEAAPPPLAPTALPIPILLQTLQNEWDMLILETLRASLESYTLNFLTLFHLVPAQKHCVTLGPNSFDHFHLENPSRQVGRARPWKLLRCVNVHGLMQMEWRLWQLLHPRPFAQSSVLLRRKQSGGCGECSTPSVCLEVNVQGISVLL